MNLESLRKKRVQRLGVKTSNHTGQRRIFFILDRSTKKFPGDLGLWMQYLEFAQKQKSNKKVSQILTSMLRLHPAKAELWIYAAKYSMEERGDMTEARGYMQRGLRFCKGEEKLWVEYARLEMMWIAKIWGRRRILGLDMNSQQAGEEIGEDMGGDVVRLPELTENDIRPNERLGEQLDQTTLDKMEASPALSGAIPIAIFDAAMKQFSREERLCLRFFDMISEFHDLPCTDKVLNHIMEVLREFNTPAALLRFIQQPILGQNAASAAFPAKLRLSLDRLDTTFNQPRTSSAKNEISMTQGVLEEHILQWMLHYLEDKELDPDIRKVFEIMVGRVWRQFEAAVMDKSDERCTQVSELIRNLQAHGPHDTAEAATVWAGKIWPDKADLFSQPRQLQVE